MLKASLQSKFSDDEDDAASDTDCTSSSSPAHFYPKGATEMGNKDTDEDDIPLAQSIPGALRAQKTIRIRDKASKPTRARTGVETKQSTSPEFAESLAYRLIQLKSNRPATTSRIPPSVTQTNQAHALLLDSLSSPPKPQPDFPISLNTSGPSKSRSRNKSFSHQPTFNAVSTRSNNEKPVLSRSSTQSAFTTTSPSTQTPPDTLARPPLPLNRGQTLSVRTRSKSFSSSSKPSVHPPHSSDQVALYRTPPLPSPRPVQTPTPSDSSALQQRVFIDSMQRFNNVLIQTHSSALDIIKTIANQGELGGNAADPLKDWMLWEMAQDFGLERPIRHFERPREIYSSWNANMRLNAFMLKKTPLCSVLASDVIPTSSPTLSGYVQWESKRGKWNKRWMELSEHSIWLSKRNTGKDRTFLCSMSSFDCYFMTRQYKAPKAFVFALKSTDNLTMFENPADYLHIFSCDPKDGVRWTQAILLARSYVLYKERTVLFTSATSPILTNPHSQSPLEHRERKKTLTSNKTLLDFRAHRNGSVDTAAKEFFQSGSLLAKS